MLLVNATLYEETFPPEQMQPLDVLATLFMVLEE